MTADLTHVDVWLFDLDHTLYPPECGLMGLVDDRMNAYIQRLTGLDDDDAKALRRQYFLDHGTTLAGLMHHHGIDPAAYVADVQTVSMDCLTPEPALRAALQRLPGRRLVFTNAGGDYAERALAKLEIDDLFEDLFHLEAADYVPKPNPQTFARLVHRHAIDAGKACFFEDSERNLAPAAAMGMTTVLVGPKALESAAAFVHHRTATLAPFLSSARVKEGV